MEIRKSVGRKPKVTYTIMLRLADAIQHNSTIEEACRYVVMQELGVLHITRI